MNSDSNINMTNNIDKMEFYEYFDIVNIDNKLREIEKKAEKEDIYSWRILVDEIKKKVIINAPISEFIKKTSKNIKFSNIYYNTINKNIDDHMDNLNEENNNNLVILRKQIIFGSLNENRFYINQKKHIHNDLKLIKIIIDKIQSRKDKDEKLTKYFDEKINIFEKRVNILKLIYKYNKDGITFEDDLLLNFRNSKMLIHIIESINNNSKIYDHPILPKYIKIKEKNKKPIMEYVINNKIKKLYINIIIKIYKKNDFFTSNNRTNIRSYSHLLFIRMMIYKYISQYYLYIHQMYTKLYIFLLLILLKEFIWLIYKFHKLSI